MEMGMDGEREIDKMDFGKGGYKGQKEEMQIWVMDGSAQS